MRLAQPPGIRSCREGGEWEDAHSPGDPRQPYVRYEMDQFKALMPEGEYFLLAKEIVEMMKDAKAGALNFVQREPSGRRQGDVDQMAVAPTVLELRFDTTTGAQDGSRIVRLYFTEPVELPGSLVARKLASKYPDDAGLDEQSAQAREAAIRGDQHVAVRTSVVPQYAAMTYWSCGGE